jgi:hypothetical protein
MNIKKIIARDGFVVLWSLVLGGLVYFIANFLWSSTTPRILNSADLQKLTSGGFNRQLRLSHFWFNVKIAGFFIAFGGGYLAYWLIRFITWAVRTPKGKK